jgi:hypothetical protein
MQFSKTYSRSELQDLPIEMKYQQIKERVEVISQEIISAARNGKLKYFKELLKIPEPPGRAGCVLDYKPTPQDLVEGLKLKFPNITIEYIENDWVECGPQMKRKLTGIRVDWS